MAVRRIKVNGNNIDEAIDNIFGITYDKNGKKVCPKYCHQCKHTRYDDGCVYCDNKKSRYYQERVRSWDTACSEYKEV